MTTLTGAYPVNLFYEDRTFEPQPLCSIPIRRSMEDEPENRYGDVEIGHLSLPTDTSTYHWFWIAADRLALVNKAVRQHAQDMGDAILYMMKAQAAQKLKTTTAGFKNLKHHDGVNDSLKQIHKDGALPGFAGNFIRLLRMLMVLSEPANSYADLETGQFGLPAHISSTDGGLSESDKSSQKEIPTDSWQHMKEKRKDVNTSRAHGTADTQVVCPPPPTVSIPPEALSHPAAPPSPNPMSVMGSSPLPSPIPIQRTSAPPNSITIEGNSPPQNPILKEHTSAPPNSILNEGTCPSSNTISNDRTSAAPNSTSNESPNPIPIFVSSPPPPPPPLPTPPPNPMSIEGATHAIFNDEILRICFILVDIIATAAISSMQSAVTVENKHLRSLILAANICFAISFVTAFIGFSWIGILRSCGNASNRNQGNYCHHILKISMVVVAVGFMCLGTFMILAFNIERALM